MTIAILDIESRTTFTPRNGTKTKGYKCFPIHGEPSSIVNCSKHYKLNQLILVSEDDVIQKVFGSSHDIDIWYEALSTVGYFNKKIYPGNRTSELINRVLYVRTCIKPFPSKTFTIDPSNCKVFDDAFTIHNGKLGIHIVDVSYFPLACNINNKVNYKTCMFKGKYMSVFPTELTKNLSLNKDELKNTITLWINMETLETTLEKDVIKVQRHYNYKNVDNNIIEIFEKVTHDFTTKHNLKIDYPYTEKRISNVLVYQLMYIFSYEFYTKTLDKLGYTILRNDKGSGEKYYSITDKIDKKNFFFEFLTSPLRSLFPCFFQKILFEEWSINQTSEIVLWLNNLKHRHLLCSSTMNNINLLKNVETNYETTTRVYISRVCEGGIIVVIRDVKYFIIFENISLKNDDDYISYIDAEFDIVEGDVWIGIVRYKHVSFNKNKGILIDFLEKENL